MPCRHIRLNQSIIIIIECMSHKTGFFVASSVLVARSLNQIGSSRPSPLLRRNRPSGLTTPKFGSKIQSRSRLRVAQMSSRARSLEQDYHITASLSVMTPPMTGVTVRSYSVSCSLKSDTMLTVDTTRAPSSTEPMTKVESSTLNDIDRKLKDLNQ